MAGGKIAFITGVVELETFARIVEVDLRGMVISVLVPGRPRHPSSTGSRRDSLGQVEAAIPTQRVAQPLEVAQAALSVRSDRPSCAIGSMLIVDGGFTAQ